MTSSRTRSSTGSAERCDRDDISVAGLQRQPLDRADLEYVDHGGNGSNSCDRQASISSLENADAPGSTNSHMHSWANISGPSRVRSFSRKADEIRGQSSAVRFTRW